MKTLGTVMVAGAGLLMSGSMTTVPALAGAAGGGAFTCPTDVQAATRNRTGANMRFIAGIPLVTVGAGYQPGRLAFRSTAIQAAPPARRHHPSATGRLDLPGIAITLGGFERHPGAGQRVPDCVAASLEDALGIGAAGHGRMVDAWCDGLYGGVRIRAIRVGSTVPAPVLYAPPTSRAPRCSIHSASGRGPASPDGRRTSPRGSGLARPACRGSTQVVADRLLADPERIRDLAIP